MAATKEQTLEDYEVFEALEELKANGSPLPDNGFIRPMNAAAPDDRGDPTRKVRVFLTETGEPRDVPFWTLEGKNSILLRRNTDGSRMFSVKQPVDAEWRPGEILCHLHKEHPNRPQYIAMGLSGKSCVAAHLASQFDLRQHMASKHRKEWAIIQEAEQRIRDDEQREWMRLQAEAARAAIKKGAA